ncbi:MAG: hypothetical protein ABIJ56_07495 [Pseudomonadota bacterium]
MKRCLNVMLVVPMMIFWTSCSQMTTFEMPDIDAGADALDDDAGTDMSSDFPEDDAPDVSPDTDAAPDPDVVEEDVEEEVVGDPAQDDAVEDEVVEDPVDEDAAQEDLEEEEAPEPCGNGDVDDGEDCDDGRNGDPDDGCRDDCTFSCTQSPDCADLDPCNGQETCNTETHTCGDGDPLDDGYVCRAEPRGICLSETCVESACGDGFVDTGGDEQCEPPGVDDCSAECRIMCTEPEDCPDDGNTCNGDEYCDTDAGECARRDAPEDGTVCSDDPRSVCLSQTCQESLCGDGYVDEVRDEDCDDGANGNPDDGCTDDCEFSCYEASEAGDCDDDQACSEDTCDTDTHMCVNAVITGTDHVCRPAAGDCDVEDTCDGVNAACPADVIVAEGIECRASAGDCDGAEQCDGLVGTCPDDAFAPAGTPCDDENDCSMLDVCDDAGGCAGTETCAASPIVGTGGDTRLGICVTDGSCDAAVGGPGCSSSHHVYLKSSWTNWDADETFSLTLCGTYWAATSPPLDTGVEQCWMFYHSQSGTWFYADQSDPAVCGPGHCEHDSCATTF